MTVVTIPHSYKSLPSGEYVLVPKPEYEQLVHRARIVPIATMTAHDRMSSARADREIKAGKFYSLEQVKHELDSLSHRKRKTRS